MSTERNSASAAVLFDAARTRVSQIFDLVEQYNEIRDVLVEMGYSIPRDKQDED